jgi:transposase
MPDVTSNARSATSPITFVALDVHKSSITAAVLAADGGAPEVHKLESDERAIRRFLRRLSEPEHLAVCYEAGPCGYEPYRLITSLGVACDIVAPSLTPQRPGERVKTDRRDALKLVRLYRAGELGFVCPPTPAQEGLRDLLRCRDDLRCARTAARHRASKQLLRHGRIYREGRRAWTGRYHAWLRRQRLEEPLAQLALEEMMAHLEVLDAQLAALDRRLCEIAASEPWREAAGVLACFRGIGPLTALSLLGEIGDFHRFASPRELMSFLGLTVKRALLGAALSARRADQDRQPPRPPPAHRGGLAVPASALRAPPSPRPSRAARRPQPRLAGAAAPLCALPPPDGRRQAALRGHRRRGARALRLSLGGHDRAAAA